ncbi:CRISPR-associated helicase/endonuclease Cas3 [Ammoniphilus oxalaticus]|uniref:CRISPR-associated helicase/endonuclease Cas3 n=1 Tax=Ammoniphilus oxalaticus TaxID=66863 RepID=A0A419SLJ9_9BACL|nr:CRISPR-associated helicase Cas3' [Ammoniphilus oxalaticus]RKD24949.1 CRISPR-associated helicase/endonuclease Cas3 [Ammoniphilus oxalaticus]
MSFIAHIRASDGQKQTVEEHLLEVKRLAEISGEKFGAKHLAGLAGLLHDFGKCTHQFKEYILEAFNNPEAPPKRGSVDHSTAGGKLLYELYHNRTDNPYLIILAEIVGNVIISHHSYLQDFLAPTLESPYLRRVRDKELDDFHRAQQYFFEYVMNRNDFDVYVSEAAMELENFLQETPPENHAEQLMFLTKFIFSALIDADRTDARLFEENTLYNSKNNGLLFKTYYERLMGKLNSFKNESLASHPINILRSEMSEQCERFAIKPSGIYTLSIPTGGGKTLASLRYALKHSLEYSKDRIVFVVPFTTIIEQNAAEARKVLQDEMNILEHHSNVIDDGVDDEAQDGIVNMRQKWKLAKDTWDAPIIFTTMVQFLNAFYAKGSRNIRRLHNLSNSVIIFDEVQKVPVKCVSLFNQALNYLKYSTDSSIVLCTATQPALDFVEHKLKIGSDAEMIDQLNEVIEAFKRVEIIDKATNGPINNEQLVDFIGQLMGGIQSILVILNTKSVVKDLYQKLIAQGTDYEIFHLSTSMCAAHRNDIFKKIRDCLGNNQKIICISTQLIEAGVDVSFDSVIRSLAGLDSIAQAAGRCNRHGEKEIGTVYVIDHEQERLDRLEEIKKGKEVAKKILVDLKRHPSVYGGHLLSREAMERYFQEYYTDMETNLNYFIPKLEKEMIELLTSHRRGNSSLAKAYQSKHGSLPPLYLINSYYSAAEHFEVIDDMTTAVLVPYKEGEELIAALNSYAGSFEDVTKFLRKAQQYSINLYKHEFEYLAQDGGLVSFLDGQIFALTEGAYHGEFGFNLENDSEFGFQYF